MLTLGELRWALPWYYKDYLQFSSQANWPM